VERRNRTGGASPRKFPVKLRILVHEVAILIVSLEDAAGEKKQKTGGASPRNFPERV
jgi:hypothetical protein